MAFVVVRFPNSVAKFDGNTEDVQFAVMTLAFELLCDSVASKSVEMMGRQIGPKEVGAFFLSKAAEKMRTTIAAEEKEAKRANA